MDRKALRRPLDAAPSWPALHEVLRDKSRNILFNHLGLGEDEKKLIMQPDCADLPYFLRAYFAFKMGLPFGYSKCSRGGGGEPPKCPQWWNIQKEEPPPAAPGPQYASGGLFGAFGEPVARPAPRVPPRPPGLVRGFGYYLRTTVADAVHSGSGRTALADDNTDYYPVPLKQETLRPGTIYADPYGHVLVIAKRIAQTGDAAGVFLAVDGQPDGTVARKRFWRGNFLYAQEPSSGPGFKRFRPIVLAKTGGLRQLTNDEIVKDPQYADFSLEQAKLGVEDFYDRMDDVMSPSPLDPVRALKEAITSLEEQAKTRVNSVENGRKYQGPEVAMPDGPSIFETTGAWEDFATPSRDLRLLIAIDVVRTFPDRVARRPERYAMPKDKSIADVKAELRKRARLRAGGTQVHLYAQRWLAMDARAQRHDRPHAGARDGVQRQRLRRAALGRPRQERRGSDVQAACARPAAREDGGVPRVVSRTAAPRAKGRVTAVSLTSPAPALRAAGPRRR